MPAVVNKDVEAEYRGAEAGRTTLDAIKKEASSKDPKIDGVIRFEGNRQRDAMVVGALAIHEENNPSFNGVNNNCSTYAKTGVEAASGQTVDGTEPSIYGPAATPNQLYKDSVNLQGAEVLIDPGQKVEGDNSVVIYNSPAPVLSNSASSESEQDEGTQ